MGADLEDVDGGGPESPECPVALSVVSESSAVTDRSSVEVVSPSTESPSVEVVSALAESAVVPSGVISAAESSGVDSMVALVDGASDSSVDDGSIVA